MKGLRPETQSLSMAGLKPDLPSQTHRSQPRRAFDLFGIRVNAHGALNETGNPTGETAVTAADIQNAGAAEARMPQKNSHFQPFGISSQASHRFHLLRPGSLPATADSGQSIG